MREGHHNRRRDGYGYVILLVSLLLWGVGLQAGENNVNNNQAQALLEHPEQITARVRAGTLSRKQIPNPHWQANACVACHIQSPDKRGLHLRNRDVDVLCNNCHTTASFHEYIHPTGIRPGQKMLKQMSAGFRNAVKRAKGKLSCITCHDLPKQCVGGKIEHELDPKFFRGGPYRSRSAICYQCHNAKAYVRLNPHAQVDKQGHIRKVVCGVCHRTLKGLAQATRFEQVDFNVTQDLATMCTGCHPYKPHPGGGFSFLPHKKNEQSSNHLVKPPPGILQHLLHQQQVNNLVMPLDPTTGKIFCGTCHNPHAKGVIRNVAAAKGAGAKKRLRTVELCEQCHDK
jgi:uncharacterized CHY-type Zn-finger protein